MRVTQSRALAAAVGLGLLLATGTTATRAEAQPAVASSPVANPATDAVAQHKSFVALWNEQRFDDMRDFFASNAIAAPPNHDLIRGNEAIVAFYRTARALLGEFQGPNEPHLVVQSGKFTTIMGDYVFENGVRITATEVFERQPDGRYKCTLDQTGFRDPLT